MIFISYSHDDREVADRLAEALHGAGQEMFYDKWDIMPGDSLIQKIFREGLEDAQAFLILLSSSSVKSKWVREELDHATIRRIEGEARVIPVLVEDVEVPMSLRTLKWVDLQGGLEDAVRDILDAVHGVSRRPPRGEPPAYLEGLLSSVGGLSPAATKVGAQVLGDLDEDRPYPSQWTGEDLAEASGLASVQLNDAVDELEEYGLVEVHRAMGTSPYSFDRILATYALFLHFSDTLPYDPTADVRMVVAATAAQGTLEGKALEATTGLSPGRLNRAVDYLKDYGLADVRSWMGTRPYSFGEVSANRKTRQAALELE